jgi:hypothetical protein
MFNTIDSTKAKMKTFPIAMPLTMYEEALENINMLRKLVADLVLEAEATDFEDLDLEEIELFEGQMNAFPELSDLVDRAIALIQTRQESDDPVEILDLVKENLEEVHDGEYYKERFEDQYEDRLDPESDAPRAVLQLCFEGVVLIPDPKDHSKDRYIVQELPGAYGPECTVERLVVQKTDTVRACVSWEPELEVYLDGEGDCEDLDSFVRYVERAAFKLNEETKETEEETTTPTKRARAE